LHLLAERGHKRLASECCAAMIEVCDAFQHRILGILQTSDACIVRFPFLVGISDRSLRSGRHLDDRFWEDQEV
jgi:hypothetical protein